MTLALLDLPPELIILALSSLNIHEVHNFRLVSRATDEIIKSHSASVYRALAIHYGLADEEQELHELLNSRRIHFDWLKSPRGEDARDDEGSFLVNGWREYVRYYFLLESNWKEGRHVSQLRFDLNGAHRIQVDEAEGTVISTRTAGTIRSECMQDDVPLWTHLQSTAPAWAHCEFDKGFLIWGRRDKTIEVWRRESDQLEDPLPASHPDEAQLLEHAATALRRRQEMARRGSQAADEDDDDDSMVENFTEPDPTIPVPIRGCFQPFTLLDPPEPTSASRFVYPHLVLATRFLETAFIYDVPSNRLIKKINLAYEEDHFRRIYYVEHSRKHVFICSEDSVHIYGKEDGRLFLTIHQNITPHVRLRVGWEGVLLQDPMPPRPHAQKMKLFTVDPEDSQYRPSVSGEFCAVHVSPCGGIWVIMNENDYILVITGGAEDPTHITVVSIFIGDPELFYLAFDGHHIAVAGSKGIYLISLNRYRDPRLSAEAALTSLIKGSVQLIPQPHVDMRSTSCLQLTETAIWHVARRSLQEFGSVITSLNFARLLEME